MLDIWFKSFLSLVILVIALLIIVVLFGESLLGYFIFIGIVIAVGILNIPFRGNPFNKIDTWSGKRLPEGVRKIRDYFFAIFLILLGLLGIVYLLAEGLK